MTTVPALASHDDRQRRERTVTDEVAEQVSELTSASVALGSCGFALLGHRFVATKDSSGVDKPDERLATNGIASSPTRWTDP